MSAFDESLSFVLSNEGGKSNDPLDRGGARSGARGRDTKYYWTALGALHTKQWRYIYRLPFALTGKPNKCFVRDKWW